MVNVNETFPSKYLSAADLNGAEPTVVIASADVIEMESERGPERKILVKFEGKQKALVLNKTNAGSISDLYGPETDDWIGKAIKLVTARVDFQGKRVPAIRIDPPSRTSHAPGVREQAPPMQQPPRGHPANLDDEVPF